MAFERYSRRIIDPRTSQRNPGTIQRRKHELFAITKRNGLEKIKAKETQDVFLVDPFY